MHNPRHIAITGASSGIGAALALEYAAVGVVLSLHGRNAERLGRIASEARARGAEVSVRIGDVSSEKDMAAWIAERNNAADIDLLIANAGISAASSHVDTLAEQTKAIFDVNVTGVFNTIHPALPLMKKRRRGQIAIVSSLAGFRGFAGASAYGASKAAVRVYGEGLRAEMEQHGIEVNVICPGFIETPMTDVNRFSMPFLMSPERAARIIRDELALNRGRIAFPWQMYVFIRLLAALPQSLMDMIAARMPRK